MSGICSRCVDAFNIVEGNDGQIVGTRLRAIRSRRIQHEILEAERIGRSRRARVEQECSGEPVGRCSRTDIEIEIRTGVRLYQSRGVALRDELGVGVIHHVRFNSGLIAARDRTATGPVIRPFGLLGHRGKVFATLENAGQGDCSTTCGTYRLLDGAIARANADDRIAVIDDSRVEVDATIAERSLLVRRRCAATAVLAKSEGGVDICHRQKLRLGGLPGLPKLGGTGKLIRKLRRVAGCSTYLISNEGKQLNSSTGAVIERPVLDAITQGLSVAVSVPALAGSAAAITIDTSFDGSP